MKLKRLWPWPKSLYTGKKKHKWGIGKTGKGWAVYNKRLKRIYPAHCIKEKIKDFFTRYPFNRYGWTDFKYWFKYRFQKKHQYHRHNLGLKPGYYDLDTIYEHAIAHPRFFEVFDDIYENWYRQRNEKAYDGTPIYTRHFGDDMRELKKAADWMRKGKAEAEKKVEDLYSTISERPKTMGIMEWLTDRNPRDSKIYKKVAKLETEIYKKTTDALIVIVKNRGVLWT